MYQLYFVKFISADYKAGRRRYTCVYPISHQTMTKMPDLKTISLVDAQQTLTLTECTFMRQD